MHHESPKSSRRGFFLTATAAGAAAATVSVLQTPIKPDPTPTVKAPPERGGGYSLSEHVKRYYKTALV